MEIQIARLAYQYRKLPAIRKGFSAEFGGNVEFELYSFFELCYHLKDWILHDNRYTEGAVVVEDYINASAALCICADICNTTKHRKLTRTPRSGTGLGIFQFVNVMTVGLGEPTSAITQATITTRRGTECLYELASECVSEWQKFFDARPHWQINFIGCFDGQ